MKNVPIITVDGPSGSGKGTLCKLLARRFGYRLLDSGALYRLVALAAQRHGVNFDNERAVADIAAHLDVQFLCSQDQDQIMLEGEDVGLILRTEAVGMNASKVASHTLVRKALVNRQRAFAGLPGLVADGRDMGTVIFPRAGAKVFLTASAEERCHRRYQQLKNKGLSASLTDILADIQERDQRDQNRMVAPLKPADDALVLDGTDMTIEEVEQEAIAWINKKKL